MLNIINLKHKKILLYNGFTLVELVIVVTILAILSTIAFVSFSGYTGNARDSSRVFSIKEISKAITMQKQLTNKYPIPDEIYATGGVNPIKTDLFNVGLVGKNVSNFIKLEKVPLDPKSGTEYLYGLSKDNKYFQVAGTLENEQTAFLVEKAYANAGEQAVVEGNYKGILSFRGEGTTKYIANIPSLIYSRTGTYISDGTYNPNEIFVINNGSNIPYKINKQPDKPENIDSLLKKIYGNNTKYNTVTGVLIDPKDENQINIVSKEIGVSDIDIAKDLGNKDYVDKYGPIGGNKEKPKYSCTQQPLYSNAIFNIGTPSSIKQNWIQSDDTNLGCTYKCVDGWEGLDCNSEKKYICVNDLTNEGVNILNSAFGGNKNKDAWCLTTSIYNSSGFNLTKIPEEVKYLNNLSSITINRSNTLSDVTVLKNLPNLTSVTLNWNPNLTDVVINSPLLTSMILYSYGKIKNITLNNTEFMYTIDIAQSDQTINLNLPKLKEVNNFGVHNFIGNFSTDPLFKISSPLLTKIAELDINSSNRIVDDYTDYSNFSNTTITKKVIIGGDTNLNKQKLVTPIPLGSIFCNSVVGKIYFFNGVNNANTQTLLPNTTNVCG